MTDKQITRIYFVRYGDNNRRLVRAVSQAAALRHVMKPMFVVEVATPDELVKLTLEKVAVEEAKAD